MFITLFDIITSGILIGVIVSAPMGPVGLLCIQRSLNKGQWHGFFSGVGAALSDLLYAGMTALGMGFMIDYVKNHEVTLLIVGSVMMLCFGIYIFRSNPMKNRKKTKETGNSFSTDIISSFFITLANPLIIFVYIILFARYNFIRPDEKWFSILTGLASIALGALLWWFILTFIAGKFRRFFKARGLWILNMAVGSVIIALSLWGLLLGLMETIKI
ncbi:MAG: LysE family translocator [Dysgonamonadaceae bacterium]|nr:LysE family translocator [Dysgonamonadaceae bacterium]